MRARGVEPFLLTVSEARTDSIGGMEKRPKTPPEAVVRRVFTNPTRLRRKTRLGEYGHGLQLEEVQKNE